MTTIGVRELRQNASVYLREVEDGGEVVVTSHGRPIARIVPVGTRSGLAAIEAAGRLSQPIAPWAPVEELVEGPSLSEVVAARRDDERW